MVHLLEVIVIGVLFSNDESSLDFGAGVMLCVGKKDLNFLVRSLGCYFVSGMSRNRDLCRRRFLRYSLV